MIPPRTSFHTSSRIRKLRCSHKPTATHNRLSTALQALQAGALDVEVRSHIDARDLLFTEKSSPDDRHDCGATYGSVIGGCGFMMYLDKTRSLRVRSQPFFIKRYS